MGSLNPHWLTIELDSIDATIENWSSALSDSYAAAIQALLNENAAQSDLGNFLSDLDQLTNDLGIAA